MKKPKNSRRRVHRRGRIYQYNPFSIGGYELPPNAREALRKLVDNDLFWEYVEQLKVLKEKSEAVNSYMDAICKKITKEKKEKA